MSKSPLAGAFAEGSTPEKKKNKKGAALLIIAGIGLTTSVGGVFAANSITLNSGNAIQFGQGVAATNSCVTALTTAVTQEFNNATTSFVARDVKLTGDFSGCAVGNKLNVALRNASGVSQASFVVDVIAENTTGTSVQVARNSGSQTFTYSNVSASSNIDAGEVKKITVTTE